jgi:hypothetical protein
MPAKKPTRRTRPRVEDTRQESVPMESAMGGASDGSSGGGSGAGIPGGEMDMRTNGRFDKGDVKVDRKKLFPEAKSHRKRSPGKAE